MPEVSLLAVDVSQSIDIKGSSSSSNSDVQDDGQAFSRLVEQHIISEKGGKTPEIPKEKQVTDGNISSIVEGSVGSQENKVSASVAQVDETLSENHSSTEENSTSSGDDIMLTESEKLIALLDASEKTLVASAQINSSISKQDTQSQAQAENTDTEKLESVKNEQLAQSLAKANENGEKLSQEPGIKGNSTATNNSENDDFRPTANQTVIDVKSLKNKGGDDNITIGKIIAGQNADEKVSATVTTNNQPSQGDNANQAHDRIKRDNPNRLSEASSLLDLSADEIESARIKLDSKNPIEFEKNIVNLGLNDTNEELVDDETTVVNSETKSSNVNNTDKLNRAVYANVENVKENVKETVNADSSIIATNARAEASAMDKPSYQQTIVDGKINTVNVIHQATNPTHSNNANEQGAESKNSLNMNLLDGSENIENAESDIFQQMSEQGKNALANNSEKAFVPTAVDRPTSTYNPANLTPAQQAQFVEAMASRELNDNLNIHKPPSPIQTETIAIYSKDFSNAVKEKVMVMINQKLRQVDIQLDPPELGNVSVRVNLQGEQAAVNFIVQNQQAKDALEQNMPKLREMLAENGVDVGDANIEQHNQQASSDEGASDSSSSGGSFAKNQTEEAQSVNIHPNVVKASAVGVDYYA